MQTHILPLLTLVLCYSEQTLNDGEDNMWSAIIEILDANAFNKTRKAI